MIHFLLYGACFASGSGSLDLRSDLMFFGRRVDEVIRFCPSIRKEIGLQASQERTLHRFSDEIWVRNKADSGSINRVKTLLLSEIATIGDIAAHRLRQLFLQSDIATSFEISDVEETLKLSKKQIKQIHSNNQHFDSLMGSMKFIETPKGWVSVKQPSLELSHMDQIINRDVNKAALSVLTKRQKHLWLSLAGSSFHHSCIYMSRYNRSPTPFHWIDSP